MSDVGTWSFIGTNFDPDEETANFGTRRALEADGRLFDVFTYATIEPQGNVISNPLVLSQWSQSRIAVCLDSCLHVFGEDFKQEEIISLRFHSNFDTIAWTPCNRFLLVGLSSGQALLVHLATRKPLPPFSIGFGDKNTDQKFVASQCEGTGKDCTIQLFTTHGKVFTLTQVHLDELHEGLTNNDFGKLEEFRKSVMIAESEICGSNMLNKIGFYTDEVNNQNVVVSIHGGQLGRLMDGTISDVLDLMLDDDSDVKLSKTDLILIRIPQVSSRRNVAFCVDKCGKLTVVCLHHMMVQLQWSKEQILDLVLLEDEGDSALKLMMVTQRPKTGFDGDQLETLLQIREFPSFNILYELVVSPFCHLLDVTINQESPMILEGSSSLVNNLVTGLRIRGICEGSAEARLTRLLRRKKFDEAESFAKFNRLSLEEVHWARAESILEQLSPWNIQRHCGKNISELFDTLKKTLLSMADLDHMVRCCIGAAMPTLDMTKELLLLARSAIQNNTAHSMDSMLMRHISQTLHRLETFTFIENSSKKLTCSSNDEDDTNLSRVTAWIEFAGVDMLEECHQQMYDGKLEAAILIWKRHQADFSPSLTCDQISDMLNDINAKWSVETKLEFLNHFLPDCFNILPDCLPVVAKWTVEATKALEMSERKLWPSNGLFFAQSVLQTMLTFGQKGSSESGELKASKVLLMLHQQRTDPKSDLYMLTHLIETLKDLKVLHEKFRFRIKLTDFDTEAKQDVVGLILEWFQSSKEVDDVLKQFLLDYMKRKRLDVCKVLSEYAKSLIENSGFCWYWEVGSAPWEEKVSVLLAHIKSGTKLKSSLVLQCLQSAPVPWSATIKSICSEGKLKAHPNMALMIAEQEKLVGLKQILRKYDCKSFCLYGRESERLLQCIIKRGAEYDEVIKVSQLLDDFKKVDAIKFYLEHLICSDKHTRAVQIFRDVDNTDDLVVLAEKLLIHAEMSFKYRSFEQSPTRETELPIVLFLKAAVPVFCHRKGVNPEAVAWFKETSEQLCRRFGLLQDFGLKMSEVDLVEPNLPKHLRNLIETELDKSPKPETDTIFRRLQRLSRLLALPIEFCLGQLLLVQTEKSDYHGFIKSFREMVVDRSIRPSPDFANFALKSLTRMYKNILNEDLASTEIPVSELIKTLQELVSVCISVCEDFQLHSLVLASQLQNHFTQLQKQFHDQRVFDNVNLTVDNFSEARFASTFHDKGLPLDPLILKNPLEFANMLLPAEGCGVDYIPNVSFCQSSEQNDEIKSKVESFHTSMRLHCQELGSLGHSALPLSYVEMAHLPLINYSLRNGEEFATQMAGAFRDDLVAATSNILPKMLSERKPDLPLALGYLVSTDPASKAQSALKIMLSSRNSFGSDCRKMAALGRLGMRFCSMKGQQQLNREYELFKTLCISSVWQRRSEEVGVNGNLLTSFVQSDSQAIVKILNELVQRSISDPGVEFCFDDLIHFSRAFGLEEREVRQNYICWCVSSTALEPVINSSNELETPKNFDKVMEQIDLAMVNDFVNHSILAPTILPAFFDDVSPYNYEVLQSVVNRRRDVFHDFYLNQVEEDSTKEQFAMCGMNMLNKAENVLEFLMKYKRCHPPSEDEVDRWLSNFSRPFPKIGNIRLPFHDIYKLTPKDLFKFVTPEFQLSSYKVWIESERIFKMSPDNIRLQTSQNTVQPLTFTAATSGNDVWNMISVHGPILEEVKTCLMDMANLYKATAVTHGFVNRLSKGVDKLFVARLSAHFAEKWREEGRMTEDLEKGLHLAWKIQLQLEVENILAKHFLIETTANSSAEILESTKQCLDLIHQERYEDLIVKLYEHESIAERNKLSATGHIGGKNFPDVNGAVDEIAGLPNVCRAAQELLGIDETKLKKIKYRLLDRWLPEKVASSSLDETLSSFDFVQCFKSQNREQQEDEIDTENETNYLRCVYLLQGCTDDETFEYMIQIAFSREAKYSTMHKLRALKCTLSVVSSSDEKNQILFDNVVGSDLDIETHLQALVCVARLEKLNLSYDLKAFIKCKKPDLIESLLRSCGHLPDGLSMIIDLCLAYNVFPQNLWSALLKQMCRLGLTTHLSRVLSELNRHPSLWHLPAFLDAWNQLLSQPFSAATLPITPKARKECEKSIERLQHCPIASDVNIRLILGECKRLKLEDLVDQLLPLVPQMGSQ